jgi:hypothetical protein
MEETIALAKEGCLRTLFVNFSKILSISIKKKEEK